MLSLNILLQKAMCTVLVLFVWSCWQDMHHSIQDNQNTLMEISVIG